MTKRENDFINLWKHSTDDSSDKLVISNNKLMDYLENDGFFTAPASAKYHGAYEGGLYEHSAQVFIRLKQLTEDNNLKWQRPESPFIVGMFHDLCKCDQYKKIFDYEKVENVSDNSVINSETLVHYHFEFNPDTILKGHGSKSVMILSQFINLTEEEMFCIRFHMGAYEKEEWTEFDKAIHKYPNVLWTHMADMLASKVDDI